MEETHIGLAIKRLANKKNISVEQIADALKVDRQSVYGTYKRRNISTRIIEKYAEALGASLNDVMSEAGYMGDNGKVENKTTVAVSVFKEEKGDAYLMRYLSELEAAVRDLRETVKSQQGTIEVLAGKFKAGISSQKARPFFRVLCANLGARVFTAS